MCKWCIALYNFCLFYKLPKMKIKHAILDLVTRRGEHLLLNDVQFMVIALGVAEMWYIRMQRYEAGSWRFVKFTICLYGQIIILEIYSTPMYIRLRPLAHNRKTSSLRIDKELHLGAVEERLRRRLIRRMATGRELKRHNLVIACEARRGSSSILSGCWRINQ